MAVVLLLRLASRALEAAASGRNRQVELPAALRRVRRGSPEERVRDQAQADTLLAALLESTVGGVGDDVVVVFCELVLAEKSRRAPASPVQLRAAVDRPPWSDVVNDPGVSLAEIVVRVRPEAILVLEASAKDTASLRAMIKAGEQHRVAAAEGTALRGELAPAHALERPHVHDAGDREVAKERACWPAKHVDVADTTRE